jgi:hypothetical protein
MLVLCILKFFNKEFNQKTLFPVIVYGVLEVFLCEPWIGYCCRTNQLALSGLGVACLPLDRPGSNPAEDDVILRAIKIRSTTFFEGKQSYQYHVEDLLHA